MQLKIYFGSKPLYLVNELNEELKQLANDKSVFVHNHPEQEVIKQMIRRMQHPEINAGILIHENNEELLSAIKKELVLIQAGGGFVYAEKEEEVLLIFRRGKWDLPKGKLDPEEEIEDCAIREVKEESGLDNISIKQPLCTTYHTYHQNGEFILKESFWFLMTTPREQVLTPQIEEDIEKCEWVNLKEINPYMENTFPAIIDVVKSASNILTSKSE